MTKTLSGTIDRIEENQAVIKTEDGIELIWPVSHLPEDYKEGQTIKIQLINDHEKTQANNKLAEDVLNEILQP
jgi:hypothetical protein